MPQNTALNELQDAVRTIADSAGASVVSIGRNGRGTGFVVATDRVLTSSHNLRDRTVSVTFADGRTEQAAVHGHDGDGDLAVVSVPTGDAPVLAFTGPDGETGVGTAVVALSRGGHRPRATIGFVSAVDQAFRGPRGRAVRGGIEHTAPLARGSSGGPVLDLAGRVVGINTHRAGDGFYLARAGDVGLVARVADLVAGQSPQRRMLGVAVAPSEVAENLRRAVGLEDRTGLLVRGIEENGPAAKAGIAVGDLLVSVGGRDLTSVDDLAAALDDVEGDTVDVALVRGADEQTVTVSFVTEEAPPADA